MDQQHYFRPNDFNLLAQFLIQLQGHPEKLVLPFSLRLSCSLPPCSVLCFFFCLLFFYISFSLRVIYEFVAHVILTKFFFARDLDRKDGWKEFLCIGRSFEIESRNRVQLNPKCGCIINLYTCIRNMPRSRSRSVEP